MHFKLYLRDYVIGLLSAVIVSAIPSLLVIRPLQIRRNSR